MLVLQEAEVLNGRVAMVAFALLVSQSCLLYDRLVTGRHAVEAFQMVITGICSTDLVRTSQIAVETFKAGPGLVP